jgi:hypothetical protein
MKLPSLLIAVVTVFTLSLHAEVSPIRMGVELVSKTETKAGPKGQPGHDKTQIRSLNIQLNNNSNDSFDGLLVKYWFFGHGMTEHGAKILSEGERKSVLAPRGKELVESEVVSKHYVEAHTEASKGGGKTATAGKKVPASGEKITGYAVRLLKDGKVLAEYYSEPSFKTMVDTAPKPAPAPAAPKKK